LLYQLFNTFLLAVQDAPRQAARIVDAGEFRQNTPMIMMIKNLDSFLEKFP